MTRKCPKCGIDLDSWDKTQRGNLHFGGTAVDHRVIHLAENPPPPKELTGK